MDTVIMVTVVAATAAGLGMGGAFAFKKYKPRGTGAAPSRLGTGAKEEAGTEPANTESGPAARSAAHDAPAGKGPPSNPGTVKEAKEGAGTEPVNAEPGPAARNTAHGVPAGKKPPTSPAKGAKEGAETGSPAKLGAKLPATPVSGETPLPAPPGPDTLPGKFYQTLKTNVETTPVTDALQKASVTKDTQDRILGLLMPADRRSDAETADNMKTFKTLYAALLGVRNRAALKNLTHAMTWVLYRENGYTDVEAAKEALRDAVTAAGVDDFKPGHLDYFTPTVA